MINKVREYIETEKLLLPGSRIVVGLSGGMDSMVLIHLLTRLEYSCVAAHCNFHLRGEESQQDTAFVKQWCHEKGIPLVTADFDTQGHAALHKISIEMAARELRYEWFEKVRRDKSADAVAVAHHRDDSVETVLMNLIRGTGIKGLTGIPSRNQHVVRPLLCVSREEIEAYSKEKGIPYREDRTNLEDIYTRNAFRLNIIPALEAINPKAKEAITRTSSHLAQVEMIYNQRVQDIIGTLLDNNRIDIHLLKKSASPQAVLYEILSPLGFDTSTIGDIYQSIGGEPGKLFYSNTHRVIKDRDYFIIDLLDEKPREEEAYLVGEGTTQINHPVKLTFQWATAPLEIRKEKEVLYLDADKITFPMQLRRWRKGDWFIPFGMKGKKKLSDFFVDVKYSIKEKEEAWLLLSGENIVWVVGARGDNRFRITTKTRRVLIITWHPE